MSSAGGKSKLSGAGAQAAPQARDIGSVKSFQPDRFLTVWLIGWSFVFLAFHLWVGPEELHRSHIVLGRHLLFGEPAENPAHPMFGYAIIIAALGSWTPVLSAVVGCVVFLLAFRWLELGRAQPSLLFCVATVAYSGMISSWNDHALWLSLVLLALAVFHKHSERGAIAGAIAGLLWGLAYNIRPETLLLFPLYLALQIALEALGYWPSRLKCHLAAAAVFALCLVPWAIYTTSTLGKYEPSTTHGWSVAYYGLGLVPDNTYGIVAKDEWVFDRAAEFGEASPWSDRANEHFREKFVGIVVSDPGFFLRRIGWGLDSFIRGGPYVPDLRLLAGQDADDQSRLRYASRDLVDWIGLPRWLLSTSMQRMPEQSPASTSGFAMLVVAGFVLLTIVLRLALVAAIGQMAFASLRPSMLLRYGPLLAMAVSTMAVTLLVAAVFLPTPRMSTVPLVFAVFLFQAMRCDRQARRS